MNDELIIVKNVFILINDKLSECNTTQRLGDGNGGGIVWQGVISWPDGISDGLHRYVLKWSFI